MCNRDFLIEIFGMLGIVIPALVISFCCYLPVGIVLALALSCLRIINAVTHQEPYRNIGCIEMCHESWGHGCLSIALNTITIFWWLVSLSVILGPLLLYLFGMLVANTFDWSEFSNDDFCTTFSETIFHVPIFLAETLIPDSS